MDSPVLLIIFNREDTARQVFERIRDARPPRLYIAADGPRDGIINDSDKCAATRQVVEVVDWPCDVHRLYRDENLGCGLGPAKAISWFFDHEEQGIVLEDDCLPHPDFFSYCDDLLSRYRNDDRISVISGRNPFGRYQEGSGSYFLSALHFNWGWASWRRVWCHYDYYLSDVTLSQYAKSLFSLFGFSPYLIIWRLYRFLVCKLNVEESSWWDYQFAVMTQLYKSYTIVPMINMVTNIGFDERATHTFNKNTNDIKALSIYPLVHPAKLKYSPGFDIEHSKHRYKKSRLLLSFIKALLSYKLRRKSI